MCITLSVTYIWPFIFNVYIHIRALSFIVSNVVSLCIQHLLTVNRHLIFALFTYDRHCYDEGVLISPSLFSSPSSVSRFCAFSSSSSYRKLEMSCLISFSSPGLKKKIDAKLSKKMLMPAWEDKWCSLLFYLQWSHRSLCLLVLWWCTALLAASWSSVTSKGKGVRIMNKMFCAKITH